MCIRDSRISSVIPDLSYDAKIFLSKLHVLFHKHLSAAAADIQLLAVSHTNLIPFHTAYLQHINPVSYTHLDVYKRQTVSLASWIATPKYADANQDKLLRFTRALFKAMDYAAAVSYTHLDVYKRQV